ncbi:MAG: class II fumarate hydratase [Candidatus Sumerlaeota bacterium]|nr:class II fumarate hydratase [Candidatus Sumerlaeota bacterium]
MDYRVEADTLGEVRVPVNAYYGAQTQRAVENFPISGLRLPPAFIRAQAVIKRAAAKANMASGQLDSAAELLGAPRGDRTTIHPNDHVNMGQSTNDTIHAAIHIAAACEIRGRLMPAAMKLAKALDEKARAFDHIIKSGRTHLQDAVPVRLGQEFGAWATMIHYGHNRALNAADALMALCLGGTAVGTGLNTVPKYCRNVIEHINEATGLVFLSTGNFFEAMQGMDSVVEASGKLRVLATSLRKIADDLRLLSSGPRTGLAEIRLPAVQPGSSIMPGKVNPVMPEMMDMICFQVLGCDAAIVAAAQAGQLELNVMMPVIAYNLLLMIEILANGMNALADRCIAGIEANAETCRIYAERSPSLATALNPAIGYHAAAKLAQDALANNALIRDMAREREVLPEADLDRLLDLRRMTEHPGNE